eukprot:TRINITY_DN5114_c0_g1_i1.p2 TRINITY_DN5114_c0_g1~~TRINITY_DN5114_c0_g1_i1.p2  ORF type:complete len:307 (-),score=48.43 TRINITY_DN5114_c0_g1_i1:161-1081(-)
MLLGTQTKLSGCCPRAFHRTTVAQKIHKVVKGAIQAQVATTTPKPSKVYTPRISKEAVQNLESLLDQGVSVTALRRFNDNLRKLTPENWRGKLRPVFNELAYNLESFNPAFTAVLLALQCTIGRSDYVRRDTALKHLIQPLAGEYGMHNGEQQAKTHRELFSEFYESLFGEPLEVLLSEGVKPVASIILFDKMMKDIKGSQDGSIIQAVYAMGYNLAIEYLADYEKTWMLDSFRALNESVFVREGKNIEWTFLEIHAEGEAEHAAIGHNAVVSFVDSDMESTLRGAMLDHDRDFAAFYNTLADMLQ